MNRCVLSAITVLTAASCNGPQPVVRSVDPVVGTYSGPFLGVPLTVRIDSVLGDSIFGTSIHKSETRRLAGVRRTSVYGERIFLWEPGDSQYDGMFEFGPDLGGFFGRWVPNNPELDAAIFQLKRQRDH